MSNDNRNRNDNRNQQPKVSAIVKVDGTRYGLPQGPVTDVGLVRDALATALEKGCNLLAPLTQLQTLPPDHEVALVVVAFPLDGEGLSPFEARGIANSVTEVPARVDVSAGVVLVVSSPIEPG